MLLGPECGRGWRRLSVVLFLCAAVLCWGKQVLDSRRYVKIDLRMCYDTWIAEDDNCLKASEPIACKAQARLEFGQCKQVMRPRLRTRLGSYVIQAFLSLLAGYAILLIVRTVGWITARFPRSISSKA